MECPVHIKINADFNRAKRQIHRIKRAFIFIDKYNKGVWWARQNGTLCITWGTGVDW